MCTIYICDALHCTYKSLPNHSNLPLCTLPHFWKESWPRLWKKYYISHMSKPKMLSWPHLWNECWPPICKIVPKYITFHWIAPRQVLWFENLKSSKLAPAKRKIKSLWAFRLHPNTFTKLLLRSFVPQSLVTAAVPAVPHTCYSLMCYFITPLCTTSNITRRCMLFNCYLNVHVFLHNPVPPLHNF